MSYKSCFGACASGARTSGFAVESLEDRRLMSASLPQVALIHGWADERPAVQADKGPVARPHKVRAKPTYALSTGTNAPADFFPIGVWYQPTWLMSHWKSAGVNTLVGYEAEGGGVSLDTWRSAADANGFRTIRQAAKNPNDDVNDPSLLAWMLGDEPDLHGVKSSTLVGQYNALKAVDPSRPVFVNFDGSRVLKWQGKMSSKGYQSYLAAADWSGSDVYPVTGWNNPNALTAPGDAAYRLAAYSNGKPQFAFIETSDQELPWMPRKVPGASAAQVRAQIWAAINRGAKGIVYFPQQIGWGFAFDKTPSAVLAEITKQNARLTAIAGALESTLNPAGLSMRVAKPLEGSYRSYGGKSYFLVTNMAKQGVDGSVTFSAPNVNANGATWANVNGEGRGVTVENGSFTDHFGAYETHVYVVG